VELSERTVASGGEIEEREKIGERKVREEIRKEQ